MERERDGGQWAPKNLIKDPHRVQLDTLTHMHRIVLIQSRRRTHGEHTY